MDLATGKELSRRPAFLDRRVIRRATGSLAGTSALAFRAVERRPLRLHDPHDDPAVAAAFAAHAPRARLARPAVHHERVRNLPLLDVVDVGVGAIGAAVLECLQRVADRFQQPAREPRQLGA